MRSSSPRNALAFLGDKLQAKRDEAFLEEYRRQAHAALAKDPYSSVYSEDPEVPHRQPVIKSTIKYEPQRPGDRSAFATSNEVLYYSPVNPSAEHGRSSNSPRLRRSEFQGQDGSGTSPRGSTLSPTPRRSMLSRASPTDILTRTTAPDMFSNTAGTATLRRASTADKGQNLSATLQLGGIIAARTSRDQDKGWDSVSPRTAMFARESISPRTALMGRDSISPRSAILGRGSVSPRSAMVGRGSISPCSAMVGKDSPRSGSSDRTGDHSNLS